MENFSQTNHRLEALQNRLVIRNDIHDVAKLSSFLKESFEMMHLEPSVAHQFRLAVEESVVNVIQYAYPLGTEGQIEVRMSLDGDGVKAMIVDTGTPFDPTAQDASDISLSAEDRQIGGLGIHLMRELVDVVHYERIEGQNVLTMEKRVKV